MNRLRKLTGIIIAGCFVVSSGVSAATTNGSSNTSAAVTTNVAQPININTADTTTLDSLKGIGPSKAQAIVDYRNQHGAFKSIEDLTKVKGISDKFIAKLQKNNPGMLVVQ